MGLLDKFVKKKAAIASVTATETFKNEAKAILKEAAPLLVGALALGIGAYAVSKSDGKSKKDISEPDFSDVYITTNNYFINVERPEDIIRQLME